MSRYISARTGWGAFLSNSLLDSDGSTKGMQMNPSLSASVYTQREVEH